jgi:hypothetical protein
VNRLSSERHTITRLRKLSGTCLLGHRTLTDS